MLIVAAIGGGAFVVASLIVSLRLPALARRTSELPELLIGLGLLLMGGIGYPLNTAARLLGDSPSLQTALFVVHALLGSVSASSLWLAFMPPERYPGWNLAHAGAGA